MKLRLVKKLCFKKRVNYWLVFWLESLADVPEIGGDVLVYVAAYLDRL